MAITLTFDQPDAGIPAGAVDRGRTDIKSTGAIAATRAYPVTITVGSIPTGALVDVVLLDEPPNSNPLLTELAPETWTLEYDVGCWGPFRVRVTATASGEVVSSVTRRISIRSPGYHIDYPGLAERYDPNATLVPTVPSVEQTEMNEGSTNRPLVDFHRQMVEAIETGGSGGGGVIPDGSITEDKLAPELSDNLLRADGTIPFTGNQDAAGHIIHNVGTPLLPDDAVPLATVLAAVNRAGTRTPCRLVATTPITASNTQVIDSIATVNGDRVLLTAQASAAANGIYIANDAGAWVRSTDADSSEELLPGMVIFITAGTVNADSGWILSTDAPIALGTSPLTFTRFTGASQVVAGAGLTKTANSLDVVAHADGSVVVSADAVQVGTLATDAQHGARGGGTQHAAATPSVPGFISAADKTKLDGVASSAAALTSSAPANVGTTAAVGVGTTAARSDHVHAHAAQTDGTLHAPATTSAAGFLSAGDKTKLDGVSSGAAALASTAPAAVAFSGSVGVGTTAARADHVHAHAAQTDGTLHAPATTSVAGFLSAGDKTKLDGVSSGAAALTATAPTQITVTTAAVGVETAAARGDHVHSVSTGAPSALAVAGAQSTGSATSLARSDHQHAMPDVATASVPGFLSAADKTKLDGIAAAAAALTSTAPVNVDNATNAVGVGTTAARHDHRHTVSIGTPVALTVGGANAQGSATSLVRSDHTHAMPGLVTTGVDGFASAADKTKLDGVETGAQVTSFARVQTALAAASSPVSFNAQKLTGVADPTAAQEVATKAYVDAIASGLDIKASCRLVATSNLPALSGTQTVDGFTTAPGERVLVTAQAVAASNGIYLTSSGTWLRTTDADVSAEVTSGLYTYITEGTANADSGWALTTNDPIILGTTPLVFTQVSGAGQITAGAALTKTGNVLDVAVHGDGSIVVTADSLQLGVIATDAQHGARAGGTTHAAVIAGGASGFMTGLDKTKLDGVAASAAALTGTAPANVGTTAAVGVGTTAARSDHVHAHAAQTDGTLHAAATTSVAGFMAAADKARLDSLSASFKSSVRVASVTNIPNIQIPGMQPNTIDGIALAVGDRILYKDASASSEWRHGIYYVTVVGTGSDGTWLRSTESDATGELVTGSVVYVAEGTHAGQWWQLTTLGTINLGATLQTWAQHTAALGTDAQHGTRGGGSLHAAVIAAGASGFMTGSDKTKLDGIATSAAAVASTQPLAVDGSTGNGGVATTASRVDHRHQVTTGSPAALTVPGTAADGTSNSLARADHKHAMPSAGTPVALTLAGANAPGSAATLALSDHVHALPATSAPAALTVGAASSAGAAVTIPRSDHVHAMPGLASISVDGFFAATDKVRLDSMASGAAALSSTAPNTVGTANEIGVGTTAARHNHVHAHGSHSDQTNHAVATGSLAGFMAALDKFQFDIMREGVAWAIAPTPTSPTAGSIAVLQGPGPLSVTFPASPGNGDTITVVCVPNTPFTWTVSASPKLLRDPLGTRAAATSLAFTSGDGSITWTYCVNLGTWEIQEAFQLTQLASDPATNGFRLAPTADDSVPGDGTFSTVYLAAVRGNRLALYDTPTASWRLYTPSSVSYAVTGRTAGLPFDVFAYQTAGVVALEVVNWTTATPGARATALTMVDGVWTKSGDSSRRYLGTVRPRSATTYQIKRFATDQGSAGSIGPGGIDIWNVDNRKPVAVSIRSAGSDYTYNTASYRQAGGSVQCQIDTIAGLPATDSINLVVTSAVSSSDAGTGGKATVAIGVNNTTQDGIRTAPSVFSALGRVELFAALNGTVPLGVTAYLWLERGTGAGTNTWAGNSDSSTNHPGMLAIVMC